MRYRRARVPGGIYFFTVNLAERKRTLLVDHIDHLHAVWTLPEGDADFSTRWALTKAGFSRCILADERRRSPRENGASGSTYVGWDEVRILTKQ